MRHGERCRVCCDIFSSSMPTVIFPHSTLNITPEHTPASQHFGNRWNKVRRKLRHLSTPCATLIVYVILQNFQSVFSSTSPRHLKVKLTRERRLVNKKLIQLQHTIASALQQKCLVLHNVPISKYLQLP
jgi:hypothetical protein